MPDNRWIQVATYVEEQYRASRVERIWDSVFTADYRWEHTLRVATYGRLIAEGEGADVELALAACLLHDVAYFTCPEEGDWNGHGRAGAAVSRPVLASLGYAESEVGAICHAVAVHVDGTSNDDLPHSLLDDVVSDADNVDRFSAYRAVAWCMTERDDLQRMAQMLRDRLTRLYKYREASPLETRTGQELFARQVNLQIDVFEGLVRDAEITRLPDPDRPA